MPTYKNIKIPKRGGGTRLQRVQVLASGKYKFVKNLSKSSSTKSKTTKKRGGKKMPKGKSLYKSMMKIAKVAALIAPPVISYKRHHNLADPLLIMTGYNATTGKFEPKRLIEGWGAFVGITFGEKAIAKINSLLRSI